MASITSIEPVPADPQRGSISGHEVRCSCGLVFSTSLGICQAQSEAAQHLEWHQRTGR